MENSTRPIYQIAKEIKYEWKNVNFAVVPYLKAMQELTNVDDVYIYDSAKSIIRYFLSNASSFRGESTKRIKKELNDMIN